MRHGVNGAIKPEFIDYGGNAIFAGTGNYRRISKDAGTSVTSLSHRPLEQLFRFDVGTSLAAPIVAGRGSVWNQLQNLLNREPHPNLVRAVLASAARIRQRSRLFLPETKMQHSESQGTAESRTMMRLRLQIIG